MYRTAVKRLLAGATSTNNTINLRFLRFPTLIKSTVAPCSRFSTTINHDSIPNQPHHQSLNFDPVTPNQSDSTFASSSKTQEDSQSQRQTPRGEYQAEQIGVLQASLRHVPRLGWTEEAMIAGARDVDVSPSIVGSFPRKEASLVEFFMDDCLERLIDIIESGEELKNLTSSQRISKLVKTRLQMQAPYISKWPQALSIQAHPTNVPTGFKQRAMLVDEIWHAAGNEGSDIDWYVKRTLLGGIYSATEIYMLTDNSPDFRDTWAFLEDRIKDAFNLKNSLREAQYLAEAVGEGMGKSLRGFANQVFRN